MEQETQVMASTDTDTEPTVEDVPGLEKNILLLNDSLNYESHTTSANTVSGLLNEILKADTNINDVIVQVDGSTVMDYDNTPISEDNMFTVFTRNKTGG